MGSTGHQPHFVNFLIVDTWKGRILQERPDYVLPREGWAPKNRPAEDDLKLRVCTVPKAVLFLVLALQ